MDVLPKSRIDMMNVLLFQKQLIKMIAFVETQNTNPSSNIITSQNDIESIYAMVTKFNESYPSISSNFEDNHDLVAEISKNQKTLISMTSSLSDRIPPIKTSSSNNNNGSINPTLSSKKSMKYPVSATFHHIEAEPTSSSEGAKVLNLLQKQKDMVSQDIQEERVSHSLLTTELAETTYILKEATIRIRETVLEQNIQLDSLEHYAGNNMTSLEEQRKMLTERSKEMTASFFSSIWAMFMLIVCFTLTYIIIRLFPKP